MKIELLFTKYTNGFSDGTMVLGTFRTKKSAYHYVKDNRKFFVKGYFDLFIDKKYVQYTEPVREQDILNL